MTISADSETYMQCAEHNTFVKKKSGPQSEARDHASPSERDGVVPHLGMYKRLAVRSQQDSSKQDTGTDGQDSEEPKKLRGK